MVKLESLNKGNHYGQNPDFDNNGNHYGHDKDKKDKDKPETDWLSDFLASRGGEVLRSTGGVLWGTPKNDNLIGSDAKDLIFSGDSNDLLVGNKGNDLLEGGKGDDTYFFRKGDGQDRLLDYNGNDTIVFDKGIKKEDIKFSLNLGTQLTIQYGINDKIVASFGHKNAIQGSDTTLEKIQLADGSFVTNADINKILQDVTAFTASHKGVDISNYTQATSNKDLVALVANSWHSA